MAQGLKKKEKNHHFTLASTVEMIMYQVLILTITNPKLEILKRQK